MHTAPRFAAPIAQHAPVTTWERRAWTVGSEGHDGSLILMTTDGGRHWSRQTGGTVQYLLGVDFLDAAHGRLVGSRGTLLHTADGSTTWTTVTVGAAVRSRAPIGARSQAQLERLSAAGRRTMRRLAR